MINIWTVTFEDKSLMEGCEVVKIMANADWNAGVVLWNYRKKTGDKRPLKWELTSEGPMQGIAV